MYVLGAFGYQAPILAFKFFFWLGYINSGINPVMLGLLESVEMSIAASR